MRPQRLMAAVGVRAAAATSALVLVVGCSGGSSGSGAGSGDAVTIMGAGDIAGGEADARATGDLIRAASPDAVFTTGDNTYPDGASAD